MSINVSAEKGDPEATILNMQTIRKVALAPARPSKQDRAIAAEASRKENEVRLELLKKRLDENGSGVPTDVRETTTYDHSGRWFFYGAKKGSNLLNMMG